MIDLTRSLYGDVATDENGEHLFSDDIVAGYLRLAHDNPYRAAAMACRALSVDQAYLLKMVSTHDYQINGAAVAAELRLIASDLDEQADRYDLECEDAFDVIDFDYNLWG